MWYVVWEGHGVGRECMRSVVLALPLLRMFLSFLSCDDVHLRGVRRWMG